MLHITFMCNTRNISAQTLPCLPVQYNGKKITRRRANGSLLALDFAVKYEHKCFMGSISILSSNNKKLVRYQIGVMPLLANLMRKLNLREILLKHIPSHANEIIPAVDSLLLLVYNISIGKSPLYKFSSWVERLDLRCLGYKTPDDFICNDDRIGRALDKLFNADRASLMTEIVLSAIKVFKIDLSQVHNDSTSVKYYGKAKGKTSTGVEFKKGHSKDHRPDLNQIIFNLSISADGGVPLHYKTYSGNRTDDTTHIETWNILCKICGTTNFTYVADSKLCTDEQLHYISHNNGQAITIIPNTWSEIKCFKEKLKNTKIAKTEIWRRIKPGSLDEYEYFSAYKGEYYTNKRKYKIHWIYSSEKQKRDREWRNKQLKKSEKYLSELVGDLNVRRYKTRESILSKSNEILEQHNTSEFIDITLGSVFAKEIKQTSKGRPGQNTQYKEIVTELFTLSWSRNTLAIKKEMKIDGLFPLLSTSATTTSEQVLKTYKYQPNIEKRFSQFKSVHNAAPLLFKNTERVEANMFAFFMAMMLQALLERELQMAMKANNIKSINVYPEQRCSDKPTSNAIAELFEPISTYQIKKASKVIEIYSDELDDTQTLIIKLLNISKKEYWSNVA